MNQRKQQPVQSTIAIDVRNENDAADLARTIANLVGKPVTVYDRKGFERTVEPDARKQ